MSNENVVYKDMVAALAKPGEDILATLTAQKAHSLHMAVGIAGETSELLSCIKAPVLDRKNAVEELGDLEFYIEGLARPLGITFSPTVPYPSESLLGIAVDISIYGGDVLDAVKRESIYGKDIADTALVPALNCLVGAMDAIYQAFDITREEAQEANKVKLLTGEKARYKLGAYTDSQAQNRADKVGGPRVFIFGEMACGKTHHSKALAEYFDCSEIFEADEPCNRNKLIPKNALVLSTIAPDVRGGTDISLPFVEAMKMAGIKSDLTGNG